MMSKTPDPTSGDIWTKINDWGTCIREVYYVTVKSRQRSYVRDQRHVVYTPNAGKTEKVCTITAFKRWTKGASKTGRLADRAAITIPDLHIDGWTARELTAFQNRIQRELKRTVLTVDVVEAMVLVGVANVHKHRDAMGSLVDAVKTLTEGLA